MNHYTSCYASEGANDLKDSLKGSISSLVNPLLAVVLVSLFTWTLM
ncbi:hypothetical protein [Parendozoicomonas sp. Alg238-R29]|nr:hypothetical protein [Parendozoicomonas sp. Alg238-R29]